MTLNLILDVLSFPLIIAVEKESVQEMFETKDRTNG
jgi:hypothetical protein